MGPSTPPEPESVDPHLAESWRTATGGEGPTDLIAFPLPGMSTRVTALLDLLETLIDPTVLDDVNDKLLGLSRLAGLAADLKVDAHGFNDTRGHKVSIQAVKGSVNMMRVNRSDWPAGFLKAFEALESIRSEVSLALAQTVTTPMWVEEEQSVRAIRYLPGEHPPQGYHDDPPIMALVLLPPGDDHLEVRTPEGPIVVTAGAESTAVVIPGTRAARFVPGLAATTHSVRRLRRAPRDVLTLFMGIEPRKLAY